MDVAKYFTSMKLAAVLAIASFGLSGCYTTSYHARSANGSQIQMSSQSSDQEYVRSVNHSVREHYFLLGMISNERERDIARELQLGPEEVLTDLTVTNEFNVVDAGLMLVSALITQGVGPVIWSSRTTTLTGRVVRPKSIGSKSQKTSIVPMKDSEEISAETNGEKPTAKKPALRWISIQQELSFGEATSVCENTGARLPTRKELVIGKNEGVTSKSDIWTNEQDGEQAYFFDGSTGSVFFKNKDEKLSVICVGD